MVDDWREPLTVEEMYGDWDYEAAVELLDQSLSPRPSTSIFDVVESLGVGPTDAVLDIGGRDAYHSLLMAERFGCRVVCVDPADANVEDGHHAVAEHESGHLVEIRRGVIEDIPAADDEFTLAFSRDMLAHIPDIDAAMAECRRVLVPGGRMVIHAVFATDLLEPREMAYLYANTAAVPARAFAADFEASAQNAGFAIEDVDMVGSEFYEASQEAGLSPNYTLQISRLRRAKDVMRDQLGDVAYRTMYGNALWGTYLLIGKLETRVYVLRAPSTP